MVTYTKYSLITVFLFATPCFANDASYSAKQLLDVWHGVACAFSRLNYQEAKNVLAKSNQVVNELGQDERVLAEFEKQLKAAHWKKMARRAGLTDSQAVCYVYFNNILLEILRHQKTTLRSKHELTEAQEAAQETAARNRAMVATRREFSDKSPEMVEGALKQADQFLKKLSTMMVKQVIREVCELDESELFPMSEEDEFSLV